MYNCTSFTWNKNKVGYIKRKWNVADGSSEIFICFARGQKHIRLMINYIVLVRESRYSLLVTIACYYLDLVMALHTFRESCGLWFKIKATPIA